MTTYPGIANPSGITVGPDGALWFTSQANASIGRVSTSGAVTMYSDPRLQAPQGITAGPDGAMWFTDDSAGLVGRITTSGAITVYPVDDGNLFGIVAGPDGDLWFAGSAGIGRIDTSGHSTLYTGPDIDVPWGITVGPDGALWFTNRGNNTIGRITTSGSMSSFAASAVGPTAITTGPDGALWYTDQGDRNSLPSIGRITTSGSVRIFGDSLINAPMGITSGTDGALWFTNAGSEQIGRIDTSGNIAFYDNGNNPLSVGYTTGIAAGPDGALWYTADPYPSPHANGWIGRMTTTGAMSTYSNSISGPETITTGPDGALWYNNFNPDSIGRLSTSGAQSTFSGSGIENPTSIAEGSDGALWYGNDYLCSNGNGSIGRITASGAVTTFSNPSIDCPGPLVAGSDGAVWFINGQSSIGRITTTGIVTVYTDPGINLPNAITVGPDGAIWFTNTGGNSIGRVTALGVFSYYTGTGISTPTGITSGPDGALWFTNAPNGLPGSIGRITTTGSVTTLTAPDLYYPGPITTGPDGALWFGFWLRNQGSWGIGRMTTAGGFSDQMEPDVHQLADLTAGSDGAVWFTEQDDAIGRITATVPGTPAIDSVTAGNMLASVAFTPPASDGGDPINSYTVTAQDLTNANRGGQTASGASGPITVKSLTNGDSYQFTVTATNAVGGGPASTASTSVVPYIPVTRIAGQDAVDTAIQISGRSFPDQSAGAVVLARSDFFSDALAGGPLAVDTHAPLLITPGASQASSLDSRVAAEISRILPRGGTVYILGGVYALSPGIDTQLSGMGYKPIRVAGETAAATAVAIAQQMGNPTTIFEATGTNFPDALSAVPAAVKQSGAILLTDGAKQDPATADYLSQHPTDSRFAIGGPAAAAGADPGATAVAGYDLYDTAGAVATRFFPTATEFAAATGANYPDALGGGVFIADGGRSGPMLLVAPSVPLPPAVPAYLKATPSIQNGYLFGGTLAVSTDVATALSHA